MQTQTWVQVSPTRGNDLGKINGTLSQTEVIAMKHTPGPWRIISGDGENQRRIISNSQVCTVALVFSDPKKHKRGEPWNHANAHLIAAAPDLLEACESLVAYIERDFDPGNDDRLTGAFLLAYEKVKNAIAKAEGK